MASANIELIRPIYDEWSKGNLRAHFEMYDEHMKWGWSDEFPDIAGVYEDSRDPNPRLHMWLSEWDNWQIVAEEYLEFGDWIVVLTSYHGRGKGSGIEWRQEGAHVFQIRDGKVVRLEVFASRERALASVPTTTPPAEAPRP